MAVSIAEVVEKFVQEFPEDAKMRFNQILGGVDFSSLGENRSLFFSGDIFGENPRTSTITREIAETDSRQTAGEVENGIFGKFRQDFESFANELR